MAVLAAHLFRAAACAMALNLEPGDPASPDHRIEPHGFGVRGAMASVLVPAAVQLALPALLD